MPPPPENKINTSLVYYSHGSEVYHSPKNHQDVDAGFNLQKLAWIEDAQSPEAFQRVRVLQDLPNDMKLVEYEDHSKVQSSYTS
jgi:hypothetical protein